MEKSLLYKYFQKKLIFNFRYILNAVNATNIVDINLHPVILSERRLLEIKIEELKQKKTPVICNPEILDAFQSLIDTFDTIRQGEDDSYNAMDTFLDKNIEHFQFHPRLMSVQCLHLHFPKD